MKKQELTQQGDPQVIYRKNKGRLIDQNRQLYIEIFKLQSKVNIVLTKNIASEFQEKVQEEKFMGEHRQITESQILQIKKLKKKILLIKNANKPQEKQDMRQALDQLTFLKKQRQKYTLEKQALMRKRHLKQEGLQLNKPLQQELKSMMTLYKTTQRQNFDIKNKSLKIQKQINKLHKIRELTKTSAPKPSQNPDFQIKKIQHEMNKLQEEIKSIEKQWRPRIDSLNTEYFLLKEIREEKQKEIEDLERVLAAQNNRMLVMKEEGKILEDRTRVSQVMISPQKRQQISRIYRDEKQKQQFFSQFHHRPRDQPITLLPENRSQKLKNSRSRKKQQLSPSKALFQTQPLKLFDAQPKLQKTKQSQIMFPTESPKSIEFNQFSFVPSIKENVEQKQVKKTVKMFESVAIGTTFYYNEDADNEA